MPTIKVRDGHRFYFYSNERDERPHIHVENAERKAKFWLSPVSLGPNNKYNQRELTKLRKIVIENETEFLEEWHEYFGT